MCWIEINAAYRWGRNNKLMWQILLVYLFLHAFGYFCFTRAIDPKQQCSVPSWDWLLESSSVRAFTACNYALAVMYVTGLLWCQAHVLSWRTYGVADRVIMYAIKKRAQQVALYFQGRWVGIMNCQQRACLCHVKSSSAYRSWRESQTDHCSSWYFMRRFLTMIISSETFKPTIHL
jgi:hypothetical protein